ncbi:MAG TPA: nitroreductase family protein [Dysgonomonas sp.]|nr:nitroreductase family protein [Dysgonomonas sp.]
MEIKNIVNPANEVMLKRSTIRKYDTSVKISREEMKNILKDAMTAPSSLNLQPWRFVVIDTTEGKEKIKPYMMFNELQWQTCSAIIAVFGDLQCFSNTEKIYSSAVEHNLLPQQKKDAMVEMITNYSASYTPERLSNAIMLDCGFVAMQIMLSAKNYGYDTNPIGGYVRDEFAKAVGMDTKRYLPVILLSIGKADEEAHDSIRFSVDEVTEFK